MSWLDDFRRAVRANLRDPDLTTVAAHAASTMQLIAAGEALVRARLPYRFDPLAHRIVSFDAAQRRGYGACGESAAVFGALGLLAHVPTIEVCYEETDTRRGYAHVRILLSGVVADAFRDRRLDVPACSHTLDLAAIVGAPWRAGAAANPARRR